MNVLWIVNIIFPEASALLGGNSDFKSSGGWLLAYAEGITEKKEIKLSVLSVCNKVNKLTILNGEKITYYIVPCCKQIKEYESFLLHVKGCVKPDVVHIHGTELPMGKAWIDSCSADKVVISIQGIVSVIARYYRAGLTWKEIIRCITIRDLIRNTIFGDQRQFYRRGLIEVEVIKKVGFLIGRTNFDRAHCKALNPAAKYYHCDEILRNEFYENMWSYTNCKAHSIFLSQAYYPVKGLHILLKALPIVKRKYPDVEVRVAGRDITRSSSISERLHLSGYGKILRRIINKNGLINNVTFIGALNATQMKQEYLNANLFICPSSIENSSNSLGEAQLLGVPSIASYVGGIPDMMRGAEGYLYRFEEIEMLAESIVAVFDAKENVAVESMRQLALERHDPNKIINQLDMIYMTIAHL